MLIAVLSDIHDHTENLKKAIKILKSKKCETIVFCGDMCTSFSAEQFKEGGILFYGVWGNAEEDHWEVGDTSKEEFGEVELDDRKIAYCHTPLMANMLAATGHYDAVFHGHSHITYHKKVGKTLIANPGPVCGIIRGKPGPATFMLYDTHKNSVELVEIK